MFDQFEELFAIGRASEETRARAGHFLTELADLIENRAPEALERRLEEHPELVKDFSFGDQDYRALVCLREDYLPHLESLRQSMPSITENRMRLTRMDGARALEAVLAPGGQLVTPEVGRQVVRFVAGGEKRAQPRAADLADAEREGNGLAKLEIEPSLLSLVCRELNNRRLALGLPQITADLLAGNRERILQDYYERCVADQPPAVRAFVEDELVTDSGLRENMALERARKALTQRGASADAIDELVKRRLLHLEDRLDIQRVELTHDVLTPVVKKSRDERQQKEATLRAEQHAREVREKARGQRRRLRWIVAAMAVALAVVSGFGVASYYLYRVSDERLHEAQRQKERAEKSDQAARQARADAVQEKDHAEETRKLADQSFDEARRTVDEFLTEVSQEGFKDVPGLQDLRQRFAQEAVEKYEGFVARRSDDHDVVAGQARSLTALGAITGQVGSLDKAVSALEKAIQIQQHLVEKQPDVPEYRFQLAQSRYELGYLYWSVEDFTKAKVNLAQAVDVLEGLAQWGGTKRDYSITLARAYDRLATLLDQVTERDKAKNYFERSRDLFQALCERYPEDADCLFGLSLAYYRVYTNEQDNEKALESLDQALATLERARQSRPNSPQFLLYRGYYYQDKAKQLTRLKRSDETLAFNEEAVASFRSAVKENPLVSLYQLRLADGLSALANNLTALGRYAEAKTVYEEGRDVLEQLTRRVEDRPMYGTALIESWLTLAMFYEGGEGDKDDGDARQQSWLRCSDQAVQVGRTFSKKFPDETGLNFEFAKALYLRAFYDSHAGRSKEAYPFYEACIDTFRTKVSAGGRKPTDEQLGEFLAWVEEAQQCALDLKCSDDVAQLAQVAYDLGKDCTVREGVNNLARAITRSATIDKSAGRLKDAIEAYSRALRISKVALEKAPWDSDLRDDVANEYQNMAECYQKMGDFGNEVLTWREYLKVWSGPMQGMAIDDYIATDRPTDEPEAVRLRHFVASSPGMTRFTVPADINGLTYPMYVYITNVPWPKDPLEDQARWLLEEQGGTIPEEVRERFRALQTAAHQNNIDLQELCKLHEIASADKVSFPDLCTYALGTPFKETWKAEELARNKSKFSEKFQKIERLYKIATENKVSFRDLCTYALNTTFKESQTDPEQLARDKSELLKKVAALTDRAKKEPENAEMQLALAQALERLGAAHLGLDERKEAVQAFERSRQVYELLYWKPANSAVVFEGLGNVCSKLGALSDGSDIKEMEKAYALYRRSVDAFDQLSSRRDAGPEWQKDNALTLRRLGSLCGRIASPGEGVRWYFKAMELSDKTAAEELAALYREHPELAAAFPDATRKLLELLGGPAKKDLVTLPNPAHIAALFQFADWYEKGINVKADPNKADHCRYLASYARGWLSFHEKRYEDALPDLKQACESKEADSDDHDRLGMCYGKLGRWDEAIKSYTRSVELDPKGEATTGVICHQFATMIIAERPEDLLQFAETVQKKGWKLPEDGPRATEYGALFNGFRAMALTMSGKDASDAEREMRQFTGEADFKISSWSWDELEDWLKTTKLPPDRKAAVEKILAELQSDKSR